MRTWMLFPFGVIGALALLALSSLAGDLLALLWGFAFVPHGVAFLIRRSPGASEHLRDLQTNYWRTGPR